MSGFSNIGLATGFAGVASDGSPEGDLTGSFPNPLVVGIWDRPVDPRLPSDGDTLIYNGGEWIPTPSPASTTIFQGVWDANTNTPDIANFPGLSDGYVWIVGVSGTTNVGGISTWDLGDYAVYSGGNWYRLSNSSFGWRLSGNAGTNPTINYIGTTDLHDLSIRANAVEGLRVYTTGDVTAAQNFTVTQDITGSNAKLLGDLTVCGGDITTNQSVFNLLLDAAGRINMGNAGAANWFSGSTSFPQGISGSHTQLADGSSAFIAGTGILVSSASNGAVTFTMSNTGSAGTYGTADSVPVFSTDAQGRVASAGNVSVQITESQVTNLLTDLTASYNSVTNLSSSLASEKANKTTAINAGLGLTGGGNLSADRTLAINDSVVATISGSTFTGAVKFNAGLSGSLTKLADGTSYLIAGGNIAVTSASNGPVTVAFNTTTAPATDDVLIYDGTTWKPSSIINTLQTSYQTVRAQGNILAGDVCYIVNAGGSNAYPTVAKAQANSLSTCKGVIGLATANIANNAVGTVQTYGQLPGPVTTNTFSQGAPLYVSTTVAGGVTDVKPSGPNVAFQVGFVTRQGQPNNVTTGIVFVSPMQETNTQNINDLVLTTPAEHEVLTYEAATAQWKNKQALWVPNTQVAFSVTDGTIITTANFANVVYLPLNTSGGQNRTLNATTPIASLTKTAVDYGRELWLHNLDNNKNISIPSGGNVKLETAALVAGNLVLAPGAIVKFVWTGIGGNGAWVQTSKVLIVA